MIIQEDKAPAHSSNHQIPIFSAAKVQRLIWPGNSPDLNMIEPAWIYLKKDTTKKGPPSSGKDVEKRWKTAWKDLIQDRIRAWVERISRHIKEVNRLEGGNEYVEGRTGLDRRTQVGKLRPAEMREEWEAAVSNTREDIQAPDTEMLDLDNDLSLEEEDDSIQSEDNGEELIRMVETRE